MQLPIFNANHPAPLNPNVYNVALAIAHAEGFFTHGSVPATRNNPGDLEDEHGIKHFSDVQDGWQELIRRIEGWAAGHSVVYHRDWTFAQIASMYVAGGKTPHPGDNPSRWADAVAQFLGATRDTRLCDYLDQMYGASAHAEEISSTQPAEVTPQAQPE